MGSKDSKEDTIFYLDSKEENICKCKDTAIEMTQSETWRGKHLKNSEHQLKDFMCT